jgi:hypothetical protein
MNRLASAALILAIAAPMPAMAASYDQRQMKQADRIERGRQTGSITWTEGIALRAQQNRIARTKANLASDGYLSKSDRAELSRLQDNASENIYKKRHNGWHRLFNLPRVGK